MATTTTRMLSTNTTPMMSVLLTIMVLLVSQRPAGAFPTTSTTTTAAGIAAHQHHHHHLTGYQKQAIDGSLRTGMAASRAVTYHFKNKKRRQCSCPTDLEGVSFKNDDDDGDDDQKETNNGMTPSAEDRREALFAMMGQIWAATTTAATVASRPSPAVALAGTDANMAFPDVFQGMNDRNTKQCLVESLGNRECLAYRGDDDKLLYKGADMARLVERVVSAASALQSIPPLVEREQWTKITGVLTGPMGQLGGTLTMLAGMADDPTIAKKSAQQVKNDLFAMGTATTQRQGTVILKYHRAATEDLETFLKSL